MCTVQATEYANVILNKYELKTIETKSGILLELPFAPKISVYISMEEKRVLISRNFETEEDIKAFLAINNTIFMIAREFLDGAEWEEVVPDFSQLPDHIFNYNDVYISPAQEIISIRKIKYSTSREIREEGLEVISEAFKYSYYAIYRSLLSKTSFDGLLNRDDVLDELKSETFDVIYTHFKLDKGIRLSTMLIKFIRQRLIRSYARVAKPVYIQEKVLKKYNENNLPTDLMENIRQLLFAFSINEATPNYPDEAEIDSRIDISQIIEDRELRLLIDKLILECALQSPNIKTLNYLTIGRAYFLDENFNDEKIGNKLAKRLGIKRERVRQIKEKIKSYIVKRLKELIDE